jgi:hypothetical protein
MYRQCQAVRVTGQDGLVIVINGLVRISYRDPFGNHQQFFLGTGARGACGSELLLRPCARLTYVATAPQSASGLLTPAGPNPPCLPSTAGWWVCT